MDILKKWVNARSLEDQRGIAPIVVTEVIAKALEALSISYNRERLSEIGHDLKYFENLIIGAKSGLGRKFYRDHLNHMIRTFLLMRYFAGKLDVCKRGEDDAKGWGIEGIIHDIGYPVEQAWNIFRETVDALKRCYYYKYYVEPTSRRELSEYVSILQSCISDMTQSSLIQYLSALESLNHALIGCIEFL
ncbi:MAG: hypothetical protein AB1589_43650, partial [Cyanobacteriota bacterium]